MRSTPSTARSNSAADSRPSDVSALISASEANRSFSKLLRQVVQGQRFTVLSHGRPVATIARDGISGGAVLRLTDDLNPGFSWRVVREVNSLVEPLDPCHSHGSARRCTPFPIALSHLARPPGGTSSMPRGSSRNSAPRKPSRAIISRDRLGPRTQIVVDGQGLHGAKVMLLSTHRLTRHTTAMA